MGLKTFSVRIKLSELANRLSYRREDILVSDKSPLFVSSLELIAHATELFALKNPRKYKFVILHLANAVELILKDSMIDQGISIYTPRTSKTLTIWECTDLLDSKGVKLPERPIIELLIDDRNTIQHRFGYPSAEAVYYYIEQVVSFFQRFLSQHYNIQLVDALKPHLSEDHLKLLGLVNDEFSFLDKLASISIESSILEAYKSIDREIKRYIQPIADKKSLGKSQFAVAFLTLALLDDLKKKGFFERDMRKDYSTLREVRDYAAHDPENTIDVDWKKAFEIAKELLAGLQNAAKAGYTFEPSEELVDQIRSVKIPFPLMVAITESDKVREGTSKSETIQEEILNSQSITKPNSADDSSK